MNFSDDDEDVCCVCGKRTKWIFCDDCERNVDWDAHEEAKRRRTEEGLEC